MAVAFVYWDMQDAAILRVRSTKSFDDVAPGVFGLKVVMVNVYGVETPEGWVLIDSGLPYTAGRIREWAEAQFGVGYPPRAIILTHGHFDHVGTVHELAHDWRAPVYAHPMEMPYLTGKSKYPPPDPTVGGGALSLMAGLYPRGPIDISRHVRPLPEDGSVPYLREWRWVPTPGHTAGHISLFREQDRVLIAGDAIVTTKQESLIAVASQRSEVHGPPAYYTSDWGSARLSVERLAGLYPQVIATGHGYPVVGPEAARALDALAEDFDHLARPSSGRYVRTPALLNEQGIVAIPPSKGDPLLLTLGGLAVGAIAYMAMRQQTRRPGRPS